MRGVMATPRSWCNMCPPCLLSLFFQSKLSLHLITCIFGQWPGSHQENRELKQLHEDNGNKNVTNLHIWRWKTIVLRALHVQFSFLDISQAFSFFPRHEITCFAGVWTTWAYDDKFQVYTGAYVDTYMATRLLGVFYFVIHVHTGLILWPLKSCFNEEDTLKLMVFSPVLWQMLPLCPTGTEENTSKFAENGRSFYNRLFASRSLSPRSGDKLLFVVNFKPTTKEWRGKVVPVKIFSCNSIFEVRIAITKIWE